MRVSQHHNTRERTIPESDESANVDVGRKRWHKEGFVIYGYSSSSSSSSPDTSAFSLPALCMRFARSISSVSDTALGCGSR